MRKAGARVTERWSVASNRGQQPVADFSLLRDKTSALQRRLIQGLIVNSLEIYIDPSYLQHSPEVYSIPVLQRNF
jgi:hypothetical protein